MSPPRSTLAARKYGENGGSLPWSTGLDAPATSSIPGDYPYGTSDSGVAATVGGPLHDRIITSESTATIQTCNFGQTSYQQQQHPPAANDDEVDNQDDSTAKNPLEQGLEMCAAFFGINLSNKPANSLSSGSLSSTASSRNYGATTTTTPEHDTIPPPVVKRSAPIKVGSPSAVSKSLPVARASSTLSSTSAPDEQNQHPLHVEAAALKPSFDATRKGSFMEAQQHRRQSTSTGDVPPPLDFIDPIDGHIWRAKYCVLEDGVLYFYRNPTDAESPEAIAERRQTVPLWQNDASNNPSPKKKKNRPYSDDADNNNSDDDEENSINKNNDNFGTLIPPKRDPLTIHTSSVTAATSNSSSSALLRSNLVKHDITKSPIVRRTTSRGHLSSSSDSYVSHCSGAMWEKRVFLNCVGAVRSAELEFGRNSFELVAIHDDDDDKDNLSQYGDDNDDDDSGVKSAVAVDKLVLQARNSDEMNEWLFQFHRSLASFLMNLMDVVGSKSRGAYLGIDHPSNFARRPQDDIAHTMEHRQRLQRVSPYSPRLHPQFNTPGSSYNVPLASSLSHGHGRNALHRRRINSGDGTGSYLGRQKSSSPRSYSDLETSSLSSTPDTAGGSSIGGGSTHLPFAFVPSPIGGGVNLRFSPTRPVGAGSPSDQPIHGPLLLPPSQQQQQQQQLLNNHKATTMEVIAPENTATQSQDPETERPIRPSGKYVPPHLKRKQQLEEKKAGGSPKKYVPPHLKRKQQQESGASTAETPKKYVPPQMRNNQSSGPPDPGSSEGMSLLSLAERAKTAPVTTAVGPVEETETPVSELDHLDVLDKHDHAFKRGGCADPLLAEGSILDAAYIPKKASRVGPAPREAFGCYGGGDLIDIGSNSGERSSSDGMATGSRPGYSNLRWEVGAVSECGIRNSNEDSYLIAGNLIKAFQSLPERAYSDSVPAPVPSSWSQCHDDEVDHDLGLFAIFDGHCGDQAARFAAEMLAHFIHEESKLHGVGQNLHGVGGGSSPHGNTNERGSSEESHPLHPSNIERVLGGAVTKLDSAFCGLCVEGGREWESGATALVAMVVKEHLVVANLGDCRGVVCRFVEHGYSSSSEPFEDEKYDDGDWHELDGKLDWYGQNGDSAPAVPSGGRCLWKQVTQIHSPGRDDERDRIELANGWVTTETEIPMGLQLRRMDFLDADVIEILKRCFYGRYEDDSNRCSSAAPQRILQISRVCGELSVSRALGDRDFKAAFNVSNGNSHRSHLMSPPPATGLLDYCNGSDRPDSSEGTARWWDSPLFLPYPDNHNRKFQGDLVSNSPDFYRVRIGEKGVVDEFLLLACDGLWDVMDADDAVRITRDLLFRRKWTAKKAVSDTYLSFGIVAVAPSFALRDVLESWTRNSQCCLC